MTPAGMSIRNLRHVAMLIIVVGAGPAWSQQGSVDRYGPPAPSDRFDTAHSGISTSIDISEKKSEASASIAGWFAKNTVNDGTKFEQKAFVWKLGVDVPVGGSDDLFKDSTLDALSDGVKISGGITFAQYRNDLGNLTSPNYRKLLAEAQSVCEASAVGDADKTISCGEDARRGSEDFVRAHLHNADLRLARALNTSFYTIGVKGSVGFDKYDYVSAGTLSEHKDSRSSYALALTGVYFPADAVSAWKLEAEYAKAYTSIDKQIVCKTIVVTPQADCTYASPTGPDSEESLTVRGEYRRFFPLADGKSGIGVAPMASVDTLSSNIGFELPVYYTIGRDAPVSPGIKLGYTKERDATGKSEEELTLSLFIKTSFGF